MNTKVLTRQNLVAFTLGVLISYLALNYFLLDSPSYTPRQTLDGDLLSFKDGGSSVGRDEVRIEFTTPRHHNGGIRLPTTLSFPNAIAEKLPIGLTDLDFWLDGQMMEMLGITEDEIINLRLMLDNLLSKIQAIENRGLYTENVDGVMRVVIPSFPVEGEVIFQELRAASRSLLGDSRGEVFAIGCRKIFSEFGKLKTLITTDEDGYFHVRYQDPSTPKLIGSANLFSRLEGKKSSARYEHLNKLFNTD